MMEATAETLYLEGSKGPELAAALDLVTDCEAQGERKFTPRVGQLLARIILCRNYAGAVLELCHLVVLAEAAGKRAGSYEEFFWGSGPARPESLRSYLSKEIGTHKRIGHSIVVERRQATLHYADGDFAITFGRMPLLSALMELLVTVLGYEVLEDHLQPLLTKGPNRARVSETANRLCKPLYDYLNRELGSLHQHRVFNSLIAFLRQRHGGDFSSPDIDDGTVLAFWSDTEASSGQDLKTFLSVYRAFLRLRQSLDSATDAHALARSKSIGNDHEAGEVDPAEIMTRTEAITEGSAPLEILAASPAVAVKFLTKTEVTAIKLLVESGHYASSFRLSLLRAEVFGALQARLTQARRRGQNAAQLQEVIATGPERDYDAQRDAYGRLETQLQKILLASLYALVTAQRIEGISLILAFRPQADFSHLGASLAGGEGNLVTLDAAQLARRLLKAIAAGHPGSPDLAALMRESKRAFQSITRRGFDEASLESGDLDDAFAEGVMALQPLARQLVAFREALKRPPTTPGSWAQQFEEDVAVFRDAFSRIYGVTP